MNSKMANPHYLHELSIKITLISLPLLEKVQKFNYQLKNIKQKKIPKKKLNNKRLKIKNQKKMRLKLKKIWHFQFQEVNHLKQLLIINFIY